MTRPRAQQPSGQSGFSGAANARAALEDASDGPSTILLLFGLALLLGLLIGWGARWAEHDRDHAGFGLGGVDAGGATLSQEAAILGYASERGLEEDSERAELALRQVLASPPGTQRLWENAETGNRGVIWAADDQPRPGGGACRALERRALVNGIYRNATATVCRDGHSVWASPVRWHTS